MRIYLVGYLYFAAFVFASHGTSAQALIPEGFGNWRYSDKNSDDKWMLDNQKVVIVDVMNPQPDFYFPSVGERSLRFYLTVAKALKYPPTR